MNFITAIIDFFRGLFGGKKSKAPTEFPIVQRPVPPDELTADVIVTLDGNSMSYAYAPILKEKLKAAYGDNVQFFDFSIPGQTTRQMSASAKEVDAIPAKDQSKRHILVVWEIRNEMNLGIASSAREAVDNMKRYCHERFLAGFDTIILLGPLPSGGSFGGSWNAISHIEVTSILAKETPAFCDYFVNLYQLCPQLRSPSDRKYFKEDMLHLTDAGSEIVASEVIDSIDIFLQLNGDV